MVRGDAAKATPRIRNKITNKTRLRIVHGDIDIDRTFVEDDAHDGKNLATGVDAEDANVRSNLSLFSQPPPSHHNRHVPFSHWLVFCRPGVIHD